MERRKDYLGSQVDAVHHSRGTMEAGAGGSRSIIFMVRRQAEMNAQTYFSSFSSAQGSSPWDVCPYNQSALLTSVKSF